MTLTRLLAKLGYAPRREVEMLIRSGVMTDASGAILNKGMIHMKALLLIALIFPTSNTSSFSNGLYEQKGTDPTFSEVMQSEKLPRGENSRHGFPGSTIHVNRMLVEVTNNAKRPIPQDIRIHTLGNSFIPRRDFSKWSRWYQEDGSTQVFRLFQGETNVRNNRELAARVEAFSALKWRRGPWHQWNGTYTIVKPHGAAIFQAKNDGKPNWAVQLTMNDDGDIFFSPRRKPRVKIADKMTGKPFHIRVRDNGHDFEVYLNGNQVGSGSWDRPEGDTSFRWGMYVGANEAKHDAMIFVSGVSLTREQYYPGE